MPGTPAAGRPTQPMHMNLCMSFTKLQCYDGVDGTTWRANPHDWNAVMVGRLLCLGQIGHVGCVLCQLDHTMMASLAQQLERVGMP
jgi:hypothetical protein